MSHLPAWGGRAHSHHPAGCWEERPSPTSSLHHLSPAAPWTEALMAHWIQASSAPGHLSSQSQPKSSGWGLSWWLSTHLFEICSGKQDKFAVFTMINPTEFVRSSAVFNPAHTQLRTSSTRVLSDSDRNSLPCYLETDRHKEVNTTGGLTLDFWHQKHEWAGKQRLLEMYGRDVSEVRKKKGWADIQE